MPNNPSGSLDTALAQNIKIISGLFSETNLREDFLNSVVKKLQDWTDCQCVGIRIINREGYMPYEAHTGFSREFWLHENLLSIKEHQCGCLRVVSGTPDPQDKPVLTENGSLWTNNLQDFGKSIPPECHDRYRGKCIESGFESLCVVPILHKSRILGVIHLADTRQGMLPLEKVLTLEFVAPAIGEVVVRFSTEEALDRKEKFSARLIESMFDGFTVFNASGSIINVNPALCAMTGFSREELIGTTSPYPFLPQQQAISIIDKLTRVKDGEHQAIEIELVRKNGEHFPVIISPSRLQDTAGKFQCFFATVKDISEMASTRRQLAAKVDELTIALEKIKQLEGILPICMYCKKIRDDQKKWRQMEQYISDHSEAKFSHGICPDCAKKELHK